MQDQLWEPRAAVRILATLLGVLGLALGSVPPTYADAINCGDVLGPGGDFQLAQDLTCPGPGTALTIRDGAVVDLHGHSVTCSGLVIGCVVLTGERAQLQNGTVIDALHELIVLEGTGGHTVRNVTSVGADGNIFVRSDHNQLINVYASSVINPAFSITGSHNRLQNNIARCSRLGFGACVAVLGYENLLINNFATSTQPIILRGGFEIRGNNNVLTGNRAIANEGPGMVVAGTGNHLTRNTALSNSTDLIDTHEDCDANRWRQNTFRTSQAGATENPGCIQ